MYQEIDAGCSQFVVVVDAHNCPVGWGVGLDIEIKYSEPDSEPLECGVFLSCCVSLLLNYLNNLQDILIINRTKY